MRIRERELFLSQLGPTPVERLLAHPQLQNLRRLRVIVDASPEWRNELRRRHAPRLEY